MGVHDDNLDSKYGIIGKSPSNFTKIGSKRPSTVVFHHDKLSKVAKKESKNNNNNRCEKVNEKTILTIQQQRKLLPVNKIRKKLLQEIRKHNTLIIIGETGSGKTTQIPQILLDGNVAGNSGCIGVTQPRRIAAVSIARRVAQERNVKPGTLVGYCVRFEECTSEKTRIKFLTDGMMVREAMTDEVLSDYSVVILDEAHERSVQTDVLLGVARRAQKLRKIKNLSPLKLIVMSATMDVDKFTEYFQAPAIYIEGRQHAVRVFHAIKQQDDYSFSALVTAFQIHRETPPNEDILIFLTGKEEIEAAVVAAKQAAKQLDEKRYPPLKVFPLYSQLPTHQQLDAFKASQPGSRKLIISTNVAETSVTISGIRTVIDTGVVKARTHHPTTGLDVLKVEKISKAQAWQRTGRSGREAPGKCYRTYTKHEYERMNDMPVPEIQRCALMGIALQLLAIGIDITTFDFMDKPSNESIEIAIACLEKLGAVKGSQLTTLGRTMSLFPLDPRYTKVILASVEHQCLEEALTVIAILSGESIFTDPPSKRQQAYDARQKFSTPEGDHVMMLNVFKEYTKAQFKKQWCHENYCHYRNLEYASDVRQQLVALAERANLEKASCGSNTERLRRALMDGLSENLAELQRDFNYITVNTKQPVAIHPSSCLHNTKTPMVLFTEIVATGKCYLRGLSAIDANWLSEKNASSVRN